MDPNAAREALRFLARAARAAHRLPPQLLSAEALVTPRPLAHQLKGLGVTQATLLHWHGIDLVSAEDVQQFDTDASTCAAYTAAELGVLLTYMLPVGSRWLVEPTLDDEWAWGWGGECQLPMRPTIWTPREPTETAGRAALLVRLIEANAVPRVL